ncbi:MAG: hypothetical protein ABR544_02025, partial [Gammaproteobacteria bacterium]
AMPGRGHFAATIAVLNSFFRKFFYPPGSPSDPPSGIPRTGRQAKYKHVSHTAWMKKHYYLLVKRT